MDIVSVCRLAVCEKFVSGCGLLGAAKSPDKSKKN